MKNAYETYIDMPDDSQQKECYFESCSFLMDSEISNEIHSACTTNDEFLKVYCTEHKKKFKEEFIVN